MTLLFMICISRNYFQQKLQLDSLPNKQKLIWSPLLCSLLGSKELGTNVLELHFVMLANYDQNVLVLFRLAQSMFKCKVGIECSVGFTV